MIPIGFALAWFGYATAFWGHSLVKGYNLSFMQVVSPVGYYKGSWPPPLATNTTIFPNGKASDNAGPSSSSGTSSTVGTIQKREKSIIQNQGRQSESPGGIPGRL